MEIVRTVYEIGFYKLLDFRDYYREIINPYFIVPNAKFQIQKEGTSDESIRMVFPESNSYLFFRSERISYQYDGDCSDLEKGSSDLKTAFSVLESLKKKASFFKGIHETIMCVGIKEINTTKAQILERLHEINNLAVDIEDSDIALIQEGKYKGWDTHLKYGNYNHEVDVGSESLFTLDNTKNEKYKDVNGLIVSCRLNRKQSNFDMRSYKECSKIAQKLIKETSVKY